MMRCPRCLHHRTSNPDDISCGCGVLWFDTIEPGPFSETATTTPVIVPEIEPDPEHDDYLARIAEQRDRDRSYEDED